MPSLALGCAHAKVFMTVWHPFPLGISGQFMSTIGITGSDGTGGGGSDSSGGGTTSFSAFLFCTLGIDV